MSSKHACINASLSDALFQVLWHPIPEMMAWNLELWSKLNPFFLQVTFYQGVVSQQQTEKQRTVWEQSQEKAPAFAYFKMLDHGTSTFCSLN